MTNDELALNAVPLAETGTQAAVTNFYRQHDGTDAKAAMVAGLEITGICVIAIAIILTLYYSSIRLLAAAFPAKKESDAGTDDE